MPSARIPPRLWRLILSSVPALIIAFAGCSESSEKKEAPKVVELPTALYRDFRDGQPVTPEFKLFNVQKIDQLTPTGTAEVLRPGVGGLVMKAPGVVAIGPEWGVGFDTRFGLRGDFEVTLEFDNFQADAPPSGQFGVGLVLYAFGTTRGTVQFSRFVCAGNRDKFMWDWWGIKNMRMRDYAAASGTSGRMRIQRLGGTVAFLWSPAHEGDDFQNVWQCEYGPSDIKFVRVSICTDGVPCNMEARLLDLRLRGEMELKPGSAPTPVIAPAQGAGYDASKGHLALTLFVGLLITLTLVGGLWIFVRFRRRKPVNNDVAPQ